VAQWLPTCRAAPSDPVSAGAARAFFETWFSPLAIGAGSATSGLFTGYYEPELAGSWRQTQGFRVPIYGLPGDLVSVDLGRFRSDLAGRRIEGRLDGDRLVPYPTRAEIDAQGLVEARTLLYADDPVSVFFLHIQGSGRVRFSDGSIERLAFAGTNGWPYTAIGRILVARGALDFPNVSLQTIRAWLRAHPLDARRVMEADRSFVFFSLAPLGNPALGSPGTEGVPLTPAASLAVDGRLHPLGAPVYLSTTVPDINPSRPDRNFATLLVAQDTGGAIRGPVRGDVFWGFGALAQEIAGRMKSRGRFFVLVPKPVAAACAPYKDFPGSVQ
jgi:membrane-bound lytic murein transglycosylase A